MPITNAEIADLFARVAVLLELDGANPFRVRAYRAASLALGAEPRSLAGMAAAGEDFTALPGIGRDLAEKIREAAATGRLAFLDELQGRFPPGLLELLKLPGLGPKRARELFTTLHIASPAELAAAARAKRLSRLPGIGAKLEAQWLAAAERPAPDAGRLRLDQAETLIAALAESVRTAPGVLRFAVAGSLRRRRETVGDVDLLAAAADAAPVMARFTGHEDVREIVSAGPTRAIVRLRSGLQVDLRVIPAADFGAALNYFTGSQAHNIALRKRAQARKLKLNEYGLFRGAKRIAGADEPGVYAALGLAYVEPELRESRGEFEAAEAGRLPRLVSLADLRGDLHAHTVASDGADTLAAMAAAARARGYAYLGITDHSQRLTVARGLDAKRLRTQLAAIDRLNAGWKNFTLLKGMEVDILEDGRLDLPDEVLAELDYTVCSVHSRFNLPAEAQTARILRAMDHPHFKILGHPTGRLLGEREPYPVDLEAVLRGAADRGVFVEINSHPQRLDLTDAAARRAKDLGVKIAINTDAHAAADLGLMRHGVDQARRGWLEKDDVLNTRTLRELRKLLKRP